MKQKTITLSVVLTLFLLLAAAFSTWAGRKKDIPHYEETEQGRVFTLPDNLDAFLATEFPGYRIPDEKEFSEEMLKYFHSRLIGVHPAITWGDFNSDKRQDYAILIITGESSFGPLVELVVVNGQKKKSKFTTFRLGEIYGFKDQYVRFYDGKLYKGKYKRGGWYINWNKKSKMYDVNKS